MLKDGRLLSPIPTSSGSTRRGFIALAAKNDDVGVNAGQHAPSYDLSALDNDNRTRLIKISKMSKEDAIGIYTVSTPRATPHKLTNTDPRTQSFRS